MKMNWSDPLSKGLRFGLYPKRWLQYFLVDILFSSMIISYIYVNLSGFISIASGIEETPSLIMGMLGYMVFPLIVFLLWMLFRLWVEASIIHQAWKQRAGILLSFKTAMSKYPSVFAAQLLISLFILLTAMIPLVGWIVTVVVGWIFMFSLIHIVVRNTGFQEGLRGSYLIFRKSAFEVFLVWLITAVIGGLIVLIFAVPSILIFFTGFSGKGIGNLLSNPSLILTGSIFFFIGGAISRCFLIKSHYEYYRQLKGKRS